MHYLPAQQESPFGDAPAQPGAVTMPEDGRNRLAFDAVDESGAADDHARYLQRLARRFAEHRQQSLASLDVRPGIAFLDAGCGIGELALEVARRVTPGRVVGIDLSRELIARAVASAASAGVDVEFISGSVTALPFEDGSFDAVRSERVFQHLTADERATAAIEVMRVLRPGGRVQLVDPDHSQWSIAAADRRMARLTTDWVSNSVRTPAAGILNASLLHDAGARDIEIETDAVSTRSVDEWIAMLALWEMTDSLVESGRATQAEVDMFLEDVRSKDRNGTFVASVVTYTVTGRRS
jgi:SAM-dependent methyltransferase